MRKIAVLAICIVSIVLGSVTAISQENVDPVVEARAREIFLNVMSPFCAGRSLADCPSGKAHDLKDEIRAEVKAGHSNEEIMNRIFAKYGETYRAMPKVEGVGILAWFAPVFFIVGGIAVIGFWLAKRSKITPLEAHPSPPTSVSGIDERVAREIQKAIEE